MVSGLEIRGVRSGKPSSPRASVSAVAGIKSFIILIKGSWVVPLRSYPEKVSPDIALI